MFFVLVLTVLPAIGYSHIIIGLFVCLERGFVFCFFVVVAFLFVCLFVVVFGGGLAHRVSIEGYSLSALGVLHK